MDSVKQVNPTALDGRKVEIDFKIASSPSLEMLVGALNKHFYSTNYRIENGEVFNAKGKTDIAVIKKGGRYLAFWPKVENGVSRSYSPFNQQETLERYRIGLRQLKEYPFNTEIQAEVMRYGKNLGFTQERIYSDMRASSGIPKFIKMANPTSAQVTKCKKVLREAESDDLSYIQHIPISAGFDWEKNGANAGGFPVAIMRLVNEIKESQYGKPEDQLTDFQASYLVPAYRHVFENDHGYIKLTPLGKKLHIVDGELKVRNGESVTNAKAAGVENPSKRVRLDIATGLRTTRTGQGTAIWETDNDGYSHFVSGTPCTSCVKGLPKDRHSICEYMIDAKRNGVTKNPPSLAMVSGGDGFMYTISADTNESAKTILKRAEDFYGKPMSHVMRNRPIGQSLFGKKKKNESATDFKRFTKDRLIELSKMFQGEASGAQVRVLSPDILPRETWRLGYLVQMKIRENGKTNTINFDGQSYLSGDLRCNLWAVGRDARIEGIQKPPKGQLRKLGRLVQVDYVTAKKHIEGGKVVRFWHPLGEVDRDYPTLYIDHDGFPIILGGGYWILELGIVN